MPVVGDEDYVHAPRPKVFHGDLKEEMPVPTVP
jgi:hypothetical protein